MLRLHVLYVWFGEVQVGLTSVSSVVFSTHLCFLHLSAQFKTGAGRGMPVAIGAMRRAAIRALKEHVGELVGKNVLWDASHDQGSDANSAESAGKSLILSYSLCCLVFEFCSCLVFSVLAFCQFLCLVSRCFREQSTFGDQWW